VTTSRKKHRRFPSARESRALELGADRLMDDVGRTVRNHPRSKICGGNVPHCASRSTELLTVVSKLADAGTTDVPVVQDGCATDPLIEKARQAVWP